jgi:PEP-CTERM motif
MEKLSVGRSAIEVNGSANPTHPRTSRSSDHIWNPTAAMALYAILAFHSKVGAAGGGEFFFPKMNKMVLQDGADSVTLFLATRQMELRLQLIVVDGSRRGNFMGRVIFRGTITALILMVVAAIAPTVSADDVTWTLSPTTFSDGGTISGSFVFDADASGFGVSSIDIVTTAGTLLTTGAIYESLNPVDPGSDPGAADGFLILVANPSDLVGSPLLELIFGSPLTDSGGVISGSATEGTCTEEVAGTCVAAGDTYRETGDAAVILTGTPLVSTPEPSSLLLLGIGILGLVAIKRKMLPA